MHQPREVIDSVSKACAYGDYDKLRAFVEADPSCVNTPDGSGYFPLQWAALNNRVAEATYLLSQGAQINAADHTGQTALHWGSVRGSLPVIEVLLRHNADVELRDNRGYTVAHVAAQYGQTAVLYHLALKWNIDIDSTDNDGRTSLHWAAYKGYADTIRLLLVLDARYTLADKEGCTPLHWAAIKGNGEACTVLLQGGSANVLTYKDVTGSTPAQLAVEKGHRYLGMHLAEYKQKHEGNSGWFGKNGKCGWLMSTQLCPVIWLLIISLISMFAYKVMTPSMGAGLTLLSWTVIITCSIGLVFLYKTTTADPGLIPTGFDSYSGLKREGSSPPPAAGRNGAASADSSRHHLLKGSNNSSMGLNLGSGMGGGGGGGSSTSGALKGLDSPALWAGNWQQLCVSCRIVRPLRAKHCAVSDRCIEVFDHYCPWVGNAIGKGNRHYFILFLWLELYAMVAAAIVAVANLRAHVIAGGEAAWSTTGMVWVIIFLVMDMFVGISVAALAIAQASQVARNVTTNELANWHRYKYLQGPDGGFRNPFNKGCWDNCAEAFAPHKAPAAPVYIYQEPSPGGSGSTLPR